MARKKEETPEENNQPTVKIPAALQALLDKAKQQAPTTVAAAATPGVDAITGPLPESKPSPLLSEEDEPLPFEAISGTDPFASAVHVQPAQEAGEPEMVDTAEAQAEVLVPVEENAGDEPTLGEELGIKTFEQEHKEKEAATNKDLGLDQAAQAPAPELTPEPEQEEEPDFGFLEKEEPAAVAPQPVAQAPELQNDPTVQDLVDQLEESRRVNQSLRKDMEKLVEDGGNVITQEMWGMKHKLEEAEAENQRLQKKIETMPTKAEPQELPTWEGKDVRILFPCMKTTNPVTALCIAALCLDYGGAKLGIEMECGDSMIYHARNILADRFLKTNATWSLWIDDDIVFPIGRAGIIRQYTGVTPQQIPDRVLNAHVLTNLLRSAEASKAKIIGGVYFGRRTVSPAMFDGGITNPEHYQAAKEMRELLLPTDWCATGCLLVHRDVYLGIQKKFPERGPNAMHKWFDYFKPTDDGRGEDVGFGLAAKAAGFQTYVDTGVQCLHVGAMCYGAHNTKNRADDSTGTPTNSDSNKWW